MPVVHSLHLPLEDFQSERYLMKRIAPFLALLLAATGCAGSHQPVPVFGEDASLNALVGQWEGTYSSHGTGRSGTIFFDLTADADSAFGEVLMTPAEGTAPFDGAGVALYRAQVLTISFVRAEGSLVSGQLSLYTDPACGCILSTKFEGEILSDRIEGTFATTSPTQVHTNLGMWEVTRKQP